MLDSAAMATPSTRRDYLVPRELPPGPARFVGRADEMKQLSRALCEKRDRDAFLGVIYGAPGVGKSALAVTFAHNKSSRFRDGQLFAPMRGEGGETAADSLIQHFVLALRNPDDRMPTDADSFREKYHNLMDGRAVLIVLDDVPLDLDIATLRPPNTECAILVTARENPDWPHKNCELRLDPLPDRDGLDLLWTTIGRDRVDSQEKLSLDLVTQCGGEPQALVAAGTALANRPNWDIGLLLGIANPAFARLASIQSHGGSFDAAYAMLTVDEQAALRALGVLEERSFGPWMLAAALGTSVERGNRLASRLADAGLIDRYNSGSGAPTYVVEDSVRSYAYGRASTEGEVAETTRRLDGLDENRPLEEIGSIDDLLQTHGGFTPAIDAVRNAISQARERGNLAQEASACAALAELYVDLGDMVSAEDLARLAIRKSEDHRCARANRCLARIERRRHNLLLAIEFADRGLSQAREARDVSEQIRILQEKAVAIAVQGGKAEAAAISADVLQLCDPEGDESNPLRPGALWAEGSVLFYAQRYEEAAEVLGKAKRAAETLGQPRYGAWIDQVRARAALAAGNRRAAERYATQGLAAFTSLRNRYGAAHCRYQLGMIHLEFKNYDDAARSLREALESFRNCGDTWIESEISLVLARVYARSVQIREAVQLQWDARRGYEQLGRRSEARQAERALAGTVLSGFRPHAVAVLLKAGIRNPLRRPSRSLLVSTALGIAAVGLAVYAGLTESELLRPLCGLASLILLAGAIAVQAVSQLPGPRFGIPAYLPRRANLPFFHGREAELDALLEHHDHRGSRPPGSFASSGPLVIGIHGRPGVGKTALAQQLALRLAPCYPDGQLYQNMGTGGGPRPPRDILHSLLRELQWPEGEMRGKSAEELASIFRAKTAGKRMLILLDAARSTEQLTAVLPGDSNCTVITTARANLLAGSGQFSLRLGPVTPEEAATIFLTSLGRGLTHRPDLVAEAIELCDFQPNALLAAGERAGRDGLSQTVDRLRLPGDRLDALRYGGRDVAERIASVYANLESQEKAAFLLLTVPESDTFVPWALQPLLHVGSAEAGNLIASISRVGLLEPEGVDPSGFGRYRFSSLIRAFAEERLRSGEISRERLLQAQEDFRRAYLVGSLRVLGRLGVIDLPSLPFQVPDYFYPQVPKWEARVAGHLDSWVNAEFGSIVRVVQEAARYGQLTACWQIAALLGDRFSPAVSHTEVRNAFAVAVEAARRMQSTTGELRVRLARCGYLAAVHDYSEAIDELRATVGLATSAHDRAIEAEALRRLGQAWQELGYHDRAPLPLRESRTIAIGNQIRSETRRSRPLPEPLETMLREKRLTQLLLEEDQAIRTPGHWARRSSADTRAGEGGSSQVIEEIIAARAARRRRDAEVGDLLNRAQQAAGNLATKYAVEHERVVALLHWPAPDCLSDSAIRSAVWMAAQALQSAERLGRPHARAQARCCLAEALLRAGQVGDCLDQLAVARRVMQALTEDEAQGLTVDLQRIRGAALLSADQPQEALTALEPAAQWLAQQVPWTRAEILVRMGVAHRMLRNFPAAVAAHAGAAEIFSQARDDQALDQALKELSATLRLMAGQYAARRMERALVRNISRPADDETTPAPPSIEVEAHVNPTAPAARVGVTEMLEVRARLKTKHRGEPLALRVLVTCDGAEVKPATAVGKVTKDGLGGPMLFKITPVSTGRLPIAIYIYENNSGFQVGEFATTFSAVSPDAPGMA